MIDEQLDEVERDLGIRLPAPYRQAMTDRASDIRAINDLLDRLPVPRFFDSLYLTPEPMVSANRVEREPDSGTGYAFPRWWETFVLIGTNGAGDFYCVRLDGGPGVWLIGSDCGDEPQQVAESAAAYVQEQLDKYQPEETREPPPKREPDDDRSARRWAMRGKPQKYRFPKAEKPFQRAIADAPEDDAPRLAFADWLDANGQPARARFIRARCAVDRKSPLPDVYPDGLEALRDAVADLDLAEPTLPRGFSLPGVGRMDKRASWWWHDSHDCWERGLPSFVKIYAQTSDIAVAAARAAVVLPKLIRATPIRGLDIGQFGGSAAVVLSQPAAGSITRLSLDTATLRDPEGEVRPAVAALCGSPAAPNLAWLTLHDGVNGDHDADALAAAPFDRLRRFDLELVSCSPGAFRRLAAAPWFRRLHRLAVGVPEGEEGAEALAALGGMTELHTLRLQMPMADAVQAIAKAADFPALRRLLVVSGKLRGKIAKALAGIQCPGLVELWLYHCSVGKADLKSLLAGPWAHQLQVLTLEGKPPDEDVINVIADSPCAAHLRILRVDSVGFPRLAGTALNRGAFPALTSLEFIRPLGGKSSDSRQSKVGNADTAEFARTLTAPRLKYLELEGCAADDGCRAALAANPGLPELRRVDT